MPPSSVHFNGSVNLPDAETVMREISSRIPTGVRRMTDGETGDRGYWIHFQIQKFLAMPEFESVSVGKAYETSGSGFRAVSDPAGLDRGNDRARGHAGGCRRLRGGAVLRPRPGAGGHSARPVRRAVWDVAVEFGVLEGGFGPPAPLEQVVPGLVRCVDRVPAGVRVGLHLCYGDYGHQHFTQPESLATQVRLVNAVVSGAGRPVNWFSFTVPQSRSDEGYFAPLRDLRVGPETELYFALVPYHPAEQPAGTTAEQVRLIDSALAASPSGAREWGICTECGMGRVAADDVPTLLDLHREILASSARA